MKALIGKDESFKNYMADKITDIENPIPDYKGQKDIFF